MVDPPDFWLRGPVPGIVPGLQPVAHALLQVQEDMRRIGRGLSDECLWAQPGDSAPIGFHLAHLAGSLDRLFTYARGEPLSDEQRDALAFETNVATLKPSLTRLTIRVEETITAAVEALTKIPAASLTETRSVGRAALPSTVQGLLYHAAEHSARHAGQIATLARVNAG